MPSSSISFSRGSGSREAGQGGMALPMISPAGLAFGVALLKYSSWAPGAATTSKVGFGM